MILAGVGLYGVLLYGVSARTREIGVRAALGANRCRIVSLVVRQGMVVAGIGLVVGLLVAAVTCCLGSSRSILFRSFLHPFYLPLLRWPRA